MSDAGDVRLQWREGLSFEVDFGVAGADLLRTDAQPPLGAGQGPDAERLLATAVATCLAGALVVALRKFRNEVAGLRACTHCTLAPNAAGRPRVQAIEVELHLPAAAASYRFLDRALAQYPDFCTVTQSVRMALPVNARVFDADGVQLDTHEA